MKTSRLHARRQTDMAAQERKLDALWSAQVRADAGGVCQHCGQPGRIEAAHIIPRRFKGARWRLENGLGLEHECHRFFTDHPAAFESWLEQRFPGLRERLWTIARTVQIVTPDWLADVAATLTRCRSTDVGAA